LLSLSLSLQDKISHGYTVCVLELWEVYSVYMQSASNMIALFITPQFYV
jgi:hypothetical protein